MGDKKEYELSLRARAISLHFPQVISHLISSYDYNFMGVLDHEFFGWSLPQCVCGLSDGRFIVNSRNNVAIWNTSMGEPLWQMTLSDCDQVEAIPTLPNGMFMVHCWGGVQRWQVMLFDADTYECLAKFPADQYVEVLQRDEANDTTRIVTFAYRSEIFELVSFKRGGGGSCRGGATTRQMTWLGQGRAICGVSVLPDNKFVLITAHKLFGFQCVGDEVVKLSEFPRDLAVELEAVGAASVTRVVSSDGKLLIFGCDDESRQRPRPQQGYLLVVEDMKIIKKVFVDGIVNRAVFLSSSRLLCFSDEIWVLDLITGVRELTLCKQFSQGTNHFALLPDGQLAVSSMCECYAKDIVIYDTATGVISHTINVWPPGISRHPPHVCVSSSTFRADSAEMTVFPDGRLGCQGDPFKIYE